MAPNPKQSSSLSSSSTSSTADRLDADGKQKKTTDRRGSGVARSPSGLSLSRPRSMLKSSSATASSTSLTPSSATSSVATTNTGHGTTRRAPSVYSVSPSVRSPPADTTSLASATVASTSTHATGQSGGASNASNGTRRGAAGDGTLRATDSALGRLRRVASNVSIASSMRNRLTLTDKSDDGAAQAQAATAKETADGSSTVPPAEDTEPTATASESETSAAAAMATKRQLDPASDAASQEKQARRRTWFGFGGVEEAERHAETAEASADADTQPHEDALQADTQDDHDGQDTIKGRPSDVQQSQATVKAWLPWRMPPEGASAQEYGRAGEVVAAYTDSVRRYISWGGQSEAAGTSSSVPANATWGWPAWRSASTPAQQAIEGANANPTEATTEGPTETSADPSAPAKEPGEGTAAMELDTENKANVSDAAGAQQAALNPADASPAQGSFIYRWMPAWNRSAAPSQAPSATDETAGSKDDGEGSTHSNQNDDDLPKPAPGPPTPAEKYKAEALAHLGAKSAVLNNATRSAWINYFGSRSAAPPPRTGRLNDDEEAEVMRITDGKEGEEGEASTEKEVKATKAVKDLVVAAAAGSNDGEGSTSRATSTKQLIDPAPANSRPATPLTRDKDNVNGTAEGGPKYAVRTSGRHSTGGVADGKKTASSKLNKVVGPSLLLPTFDDTFATAPRSIAPRKGVWEKTWSLLFNSDPSATVRSNSSGKTQGHQRRPSALNPNVSQSRDSGGNRSVDEAQERLPRLWSTMGDKERAASRGCKGIRKVTIIGVHGWFSKGPIQKLFGEPTGTSTKFAGMMTDAVKKHFEDAGYALADEQITSIALEADGLVSERVDRSFTALLGNPKFVSDLLSSDAVFFAAHSQGTIVATHLLARLVEQRHLDPRHSRVVLLCMCGIHNGPFAHLRGSITSYYLNTFETPAAKELFEFQNGNSPVSRLYAASLRIVLAAGIKLVYVASLDDQVVPLYSALHSAASHPSILRGIFCDGAAFPRVDFLTNLLSFCVNVRNAGLGDHHLATLLSSSVAGSLYGGLGHSLIYDEPQVYNLSVRYLLEVTSPAGYPTARAGQPSVAAASPAAHLMPAGIPPLELDEDITMVRNQKWSTNPYALPWSLRGLLEDESVRAYFSDHIDKLVADYLDWQPTTKTLKDVQFRLEPIRLVANAAQRANAASDGNKDKDKKSAAAADSSKL